MTRRMRNTGAMLAAALLPLALACSEDREGIAGPPFEAPLLQLVVEPGDVTIQLGDRYQLKATLRDREGAPLETYGTDPIHWTSSNSDVATVLESGLVEARALGTALITAGCGEHCAYARVTVIPKRKIDPPGKGPGR